MYNQIVSSLFTAVCIIEIVLAIGAWLTRPLPAPEETDDEGAEELPEIPALDPEPMLADLPLPDDE